MRALRLFLCVGMMCAMHAEGEPLTFRQAMEMVSHHGMAIASAAADQVRAHESYLEAKNLFLPQLTLGSGLGYSYGYPLTLEGAAPSIFNVNYQSMLINPAQSKFTAAAKQDWLASSANTEDQRASTILEAALAYVQLDTLTTRLKLLRDQEGEAQRLEAITRDRVQAGVDPQIELTRARLATATVHMRMMDTATTVAVLRERLSQLTGLPAASIETVTESIPEVPDVSTESDLVREALSNSQVVKAAELQASAKDLRAKAEHRAMLPSMDLVAQYARFATTLNNYQQFFITFQPNNATFGAAIRFPVLSFTQRARASAADADAVKAHRQADITKEQTSSETVRLSRAVQQLAAAEQVTKLQYQLAQDQVENVQARIAAAAPGSAQGPTPSPRDLEQARIDASDKYSQDLDMSYELQKARMQLLKATGKLTDWALGRH